MCKGSVHLLPYTALQVRSLLDAELVACAETQLDALIRAEEQQKWSSLKASLSWQQQAHGAAAGTSTSTAVASTSAAAPPPHVPSQPARAQQVSTATLPSSNMPTMLC